MSTLRACLAAAWLAVLSAGPAVADDTPVALGLGHTDDFSGFSRHARTAKGLELVMAGSNAHFALPVDAELRHKDLRLRFTAMAHVRTIELLSLAGDKAPRPGPVASLPVSKHTELVYEFPLPDGTYDAIHIGLQAGGQPAGAILAEASLVPRTALQHRQAVFIAAAGAALALLLPGLLLFVLLAPDPADAEALRISLFALAVCFYIGLYLLLLSPWGAIRAGAPNWTATAAWLAGVLGLAAGAALRPGRLRAVPGLLVGLRWDLALYLAAVLLCAHIVSHGIALPFTNLQWGTIAGPLTFEAFHGHDNLFQFINGKVIAGNEAFETYYGHSALIYQPYHREMLPGVMYAVVRAAVSGAWPDAGRSFLTYTVFGIACNAAILFPLSVVAGRYFPSRRTLVVAALAVNAFVLVNLYFTWFKFAGAALFVSALAVLLIDARSTRRWAASGALFGLGTNMHAGNALGIPLFFLWFVGRRLRQGGLRLAALAAPAALVAVFALINTPWAVVKHLYFTEDNQLLRSFFFAGKYDPAGLAASIRKFFDETPLAEQMHFRLGRLADAFHLDGFAQLGGMLVHGKLTDFLLRWNQLEFSRVSFVLYPSLLFICADWLRRRRRTDNPRPSPMEHAPEAWTVVGLGLATMLTVVLLAYGRVAPDITYMQPMGALLAVHAVLVGRVLSAGPWVAGAYLVYLAFVAVRMAPFL
jgi:hypothetical protein